MKVTITVKSGEIKTIECESFDFDNGFLKVIKPAESTANEVYLSLETIAVIENFGSLRESKDSKKA
jgi:hypothetical protein